MQNVTEPKVPKQFGTRLSPEHSRDTTGRAIRIGDSVRTHDSVGGDLGGVVVAVAGTCVTIMIDVATRAYESAHCTDLRVIPDVRDLLKILDD